MLDSAIEVERGYATVNESDGRFEFRAWARNFGMVETRIRRLSPCREIRESSETYIVSSRSDASNLKVRDGKLELKVLVQEREGLEQWQPRVKSQLPVAAKFLAAEVLPALGVEVPALDRDDYALDQLVDEIVRPHRDLAAARVFKRRFAFTVKACMTEHDEVWINGAGLESVAVESSDGAAVLEVLRLLGLDDYENVSYPRVIKRVIGMVPWPTLF